MFKFEISVSTTIVWVRAYVNLINLQWDDCYSGNCDEMSKYECFVQRGLNMSHIFHWVVFILITPGLGCNFNDIR